MNWIRAHYDRVIAAAAALFLFIGTVSIWWSAAQLRNDLTPQAAPPPRDATPPGKAVELTGAAQKLHQPPEWKFGGRSGLFVPEKHFVDAQGQLATLKTTEVHPPVANEWLEQFGLPIADADVLEQDLDGDGFNNLEEWTGHTDPTDKTSRPGYIAKLKLKSFSVEPFRMIFSSWVSDTFAINTIDLKQPTQFLKEGDTIRGSRFKIVKFAEKYEPNQYGTNIDVSELTLEHEETKEQLRLVKERVAMSPESVATFAYSWGERRVFQVRRDQEFSLKPQEEIKYKLIDVQPTKAVIVNTQTPQEWIEIGFPGP